MKNQVNSRDHLEIQPQKNHCLNIQLSESEVEKDVQNARTRWFVRGVQLGCYNQLTAPQNN